MNLGAPVNREANDFLPHAAALRRAVVRLQRPAPTRVRPRQASGTCTSPSCGTAATRTSLGIWAASTTPPGPTSSGPEFSPSLVTTWAGTWLYFSSTGYDNNMDIYVSRLQRNGTFAAPTKIEELSTPGDDRMPNVSRDGLKMVFSSDRTDLDGEQGSFDVYVSHRCAPAAVVPAVQPRTERQHGCRRDTRHHVRRWQASLLRAAR